MRVRVARAGSSAIATTRAGYEPRALRPNPTPGLVQGIHQGRPSGSPAGVPTRTRRSGLKGDTTPVAELILDWLATDANPDSASGLARSTWDSYRSVASRHVIGTLWSAS